MAGIQEKDGLNVKEQTLLILIAQLQLK